MCKNSCKVVFLDRDGTMNVEVNYLPVSYTHLTLPTIA